MKRLLGIAALLVFASTLAAQTTHITGTTIVGGDDAPLQRGQINMVPTDMNGNPLDVNIGSSGGLVIPRAAVCLIANGAITTALNGSTCTVIDTTVSNPANFCYKTTIRDTVSGWTAPVLPCVQPSGSTWSFNTYVPTGAATALVVTGPAGPTGATGPEGPAGSGGCATNAISNGCTGATTAAAALANLGGWVLPIFNSTAPSGSCSTNNQVEYVTGGGAPYPQYTCASGTWIQTGGGSGGGILAGDVTGPATANTVGKVNGCAVPISAGLVGTNGSGCIVASGAPATDFKHWFTALGNVIAATGNARVCMPGDSTFFGAYSLPDGPDTSWATYGPDAQLANVLQSQYHIRAQAATRFGSGSSQSISPDSLSLYDPRFVVPSQWTADTTTQVPGGFPMQATTAGDFTFTPVENVDTFTVSYLKGSGWGSLSGHIDGGSSTTVSTNGSPGVGTLVLTAGGVGVHTLHLTWASGGVVKWWGTEGRDSTTNNVIFEQMGNSGATSANFSDTSNVWGAGESLPWSTIGCDLVLQESGINDWNTSVAVSTYKTNMQAATIAQLASGADVAEVSGNPSDTAQTGVTTATQLTYVIALQQVAAANSNTGLSTPLPFINNWQMFAGPVTASNYGYGYAESFGQMARIDGGLHPNLYGYYSSSVSMASGILTNPSTTDYQLQTFTSNPYWNTGASNVEVYFTDPPWFGRCDGATDDYETLGDALYFYSTFFASQTPGAFTVNLPYSYSTNQRTCLITENVDVAGNNTLNGNGSILSFSGTGPALRVSGVQASGLGQSIMRAKVQDLKVVLTSSTGSVTGISAYGNFQIDNVTVATTATPTSYTSLSVPDSNAPPNGSVTNSSFDGPISIDGSLGNGPDTPASLNFLNDKVGGGATAMPSGNTSMVTVTNWRGGILNLNFPWMYNNEFPASSSFFNITNTAATDFGSSNAINITATPVSIGGTPVVITASNSGGGSVPVIYGNIDTTGNAGGGSLISGTCNGVLDIGNSIYRNCSLLTLPLASGVATLVSGTVTVSTSAACTVGASCTYILDNCGENSSAAIGALSVGTVSAGTSFVINSLTSGAAVATGDASTVCWSIN